MKDSNDMCVTTNSSGSLDKDNCMKLYEGFYFHGTFNLKSWIYDLIKINKSLYILKQSMHVV